MHHGTRLVTVNVIILPISLRATGTKGSHRDIDTPCKSHALSFSREIPWAISYADDHKEQNNLPQNSETVPVQERGNGTGLLSSKQLQNQNGNAPSNSRSRHGMQDGKFPLPNDLRYFPILGLRADALNLIHKQEVKAPHLWKHLSVIMQQHAWKQADELGCCKNCCWG